MEETIKRKRTGYEAATLVEKVITQILSKKRKKRIELKGKGKIPKEWFNSLIKEICKQNDISEGHIRAVGVWPLNADVDEKDPES